MHNINPLNVLFVEDCEDDKELLLAALTGEFPDISHIRIDSAAGMRNALTRQNWDVIICDHCLPALDAPAALRIAQETGSDAPFIVVSGSIPEEVAIATMMAGAADMISKDNLSRLVPAIKRELRKVMEMSELRQQQAHLHHMNGYDRITGLPNHEFLAKKLAALTDNPGSVATPVLILVNINRFSLLLRTLGIEASEQIMRLVGERLRRSVGDAGVVGSLGGDRFAVLLTDPGACANPVPMVEHIDEEARRPMKIAGQDLFLTSRMGIVVYPHDGRDFHKLIVNAEIAMSQVVIGGKRNYQFFDADMDAGECRLMLEHALHRALQRNEFVLHYQPQVDARSGKMIGVEALLRWQLADGSSVAPADFIPLLEETGLIVPVGEWALRTACMQNLAWQQAGHPPIRVAVNLSAVQFRQVELAPMVRRVLNETALDCRYLELEITENIAMHNEEAVIATLTELRAMGVNLAIDDFGTGYSSLAYLQRFPVHKLKIDRTFVNDITASAPESAIIKTIISLACNLGMAVIAEGVETQEQADFLLSCGCPEMQGYLFSKPVPAEEIWQLLGNAECGAPLMRVA